MSNAVASHGTLIARNNTTIAELRDITPPPLQRNKFDVTNQNDSDDSYVVGVRRKGDLQFTVNWLPSGEVTHGGVSGLIAAYKNGTKDKYLITFPDASTWLISGFVTEIAPNAPVDGDFTAKITVRPSGGTIYTP